LRIWIAARIGRVEPGLIGQQQQQIGIDKGSNQRREIVIIPNLDLFGCNGIIFIDYWHNSMFQQRRKDIACVEKAVTIFHIGTG